MPAARVAVLLIGLAIAASAVVVAVVLSTANASDEEAIEELIGELFAGFEESDAERLSSVFAASCGEMFDKAIAALDEFQLSGDTIEFDLAGVDIRNLEESSAEALPQGFVTVDGARSPIAAEGDEYTAVVKENGDWKIATCDLFE